MAKTITINGKSVKPGPLLYSTVRRLSDVLDHLSNSDVSPLERTELSAQVLLNAYPGLTREDLDTVSPGTIMDAALEVFRATFAPPEVDAPAR